MVDPTTGAVTMEPLADPAEAATAHNDLLLERDPVRSGKDGPRR